MSKRKRTEDKQPVNKDTRPLSKPTLLSLPAEIRNVIWATVMNDPILIVTESIWDNVKRRPVPYLKSVPLNRDFIQFPCRNYHHHREKEGEQALKRGIGALSWLRTNRQIYTEVRTIMYDHITLHICHHLTWQSLLDEKALKKNLQISKVSSVSFCHKLFIEHDLADGFRFPKPENAHRRTFSGKAPIHSNPLCMARRLMGGKTLDELMPALREIQPRVHFSCRGGNDRHDRPVLGHYKNGRPQKGQLHRPKNPLALIYQDDEPAVQAIAKAMAGKMPWLLLRGGSAKAVCPRAYLDAIEHDNDNNCRLCWCRKRSIDADAFPGALLATALESELAIPLEPLDLQCNGCKRFAYGTRSR